MLPKQSRDGLELRGNRDQILRGAGPRFAAFWPLLVIGTSGARSTTGS